MYYAIMLIRVGTFDAIFYLVHLVYACIQQLLVLPPVVVSTAAPGIPDSDIRYGGVCRKFACTLCYWLREKEEAEKGLARCRCFRHVPGSLYSGGVKTVNEHDLSVRHWSCSW